MVDQTREQSEQQGTANPVLGIPAEISGTARARARDWNETLQAEGGDKAEQHDLIVRTAQEHQSAAFTGRLLELLFGGDDVFAAADGLREISRDLPDSLSQRDRLAVRASGAASLSLPWAVMPLAKRWLRERVAHLALITRLPESVQQLDRRSTGALYSGLLGAVRSLENDRLHPTLAIVGDAVHGPVGARAELNRLIALAALPGISRIVVDPARLVPGGSDWSATTDCDLAVTALRELLVACLEHDTVVSLEATSYRWAKLTPEILIRASADARFDAVHLGILLPVELPESFAAAKRLMRWARSRKKDDGTPLEVVLGVAGLTAGEKISSLDRGLAVPTCDSPNEETAQLMRLLNLFCASKSGGLRATVASENPEIIAAAIELAGHHHATDSLAVRFRSGMGAALARLLAADGRDVQVYLPVSPPDELSGVVSYLVGLAAGAAEAGAADVGAVDVDGRSTRSPRDIDLDAVMALTAEPPPLSHRTQLRSREWHPSERDSALFYRPPDEPTEFDTGGLTAAVLGLTRGDTGELVFDEYVPKRVIPAKSGSGFANEPATDASLAENREWAAALIERAAAALAERGPEHDTAQATNQVVDTDIETLLQAAREAQQRWAAQPSQTRALRLRRAALGVAAARDRLTQTLVAATGAPMREIDAHIGDLVDSARYSGQLAEGLAAVRGAKFLPGGLTLVAASTRVSLAEQAERVMAALAAGCAVLWAAPRHLAASATVLIEEWEAAGLSAGAVRLIDLTDSGSDRTDPGLSPVPDSNADSDLETRSYPDSDSDSESEFRSEPETATDSDPVPNTLLGSVLDPVLGPVLATVERATVLGDASLAHTIQRRRPDLRVEGVFHSCGSLIVTPAAASDDAVQGLVASAFRGSSMRSAHAAVLVGRVGRSATFRERLADAVQALRVGDTSQAEGADPLNFDLGPLPAPPDAAGMRALTELGRGEEWIVTPTQLDEDGRLWSPGVRANVPVTSTFWADAHGLPVLGIVRARSLADAMRVQKRIGGGSSAALFSHDADDIGPWLAGTQAASLAINTPTTAVRIERQPGGGWGESAVGIPSLAGGPNQLVTLGSWQVRPGTPSSTLHLHGLDPEVQVLIEAAQEVLDYENFDEVRRAALSDALAWRTRFGVLEDTIELGVERNLMRYWPVPTQLRLAEGASLTQLLRVIAAALVSHTRVTVSTGEVLPTSVSMFLASQGITIWLERDDDWLARLSVSGATDKAGASYDRVRLIGGDRARVAEWMSGQPQVSLWAEPVTMAGPVELLSLLREQSISARANRHGVATAVPALDELIENYLRV